MDLKKQFPFWIFTFGLAIFLLAPFYVQDGMFTDGIIYALVSRNLAQGIGEYWQPIFSDFPAKIFYEQPPLALWLQSFFFKILGNGFFTERVYCAFTYIIACFSLVFAWKKINPTQQKFAWLPILLYTFTPLGFWSYRHNMLENTMLIFDLWAIVLFYEATKSELFFQKENLINLILGAFFIFLSVLTKGLVGLFPLAFFMLYFIVFQKNFQKHFFQSVTSGVLLVLCFVCLFFVFPKSLDFFTQYIDIQLLRSLRGEREAFDSGGRFLLLERLSQELIPMFLTLLLLVIPFFLGKKKVFEAQKKEAMLFVLVGFSASLPMLISPKQHSYYLVPCFVYFALSVSLLILPYFSMMENYFSTQKNSLIYKKIFTLMSSILLIISVLYVFKNKNTYSRDEAILHDVHILEKTFPAFTTFGIDAEYCSEYFIGAYLLRYGNLNTDCDNQNEALFLSQIDKNLSKHNYVKEENFGLTYFALWRKK